MDSNKDEAKRCLRLAEKYLALGDREKAEKFGRKAQRLFPSQEAEGKLTFRKTREITEFLPIDEFFIPQKKCRINLTTKTCQQDS